MSFLSKLFKGNNAEQLREQARELREQGQVGAAIQILQQALAVAQKYKDAKSEAYVRNTYGLALKDAGEPQAALQHLNASLSFARQMKDTWLEPQVLCSLGMTLRALGDLDGAINYYQQSLEFAQQTDNTLSFCTTLQNLGNAYMQQERYDLAVPLFRQRIQMATNMSDDLAVGRSSYTLGEALMKMDAYEEALEHFNRANSILHDVPMSEGLVSHYFLMRAECHNTLRERQLAAVSNPQPSSYDSQPKGHRRLPPPPGAQLMKSVPVNALTTEQAEELAQAGLAYMENGDFGKGISYFKRVLSYTRAHNEHSKSVGILSLIADAYGKVGETALLIKYGQEALDIVHTADLYEDEAAVLCNIGRGLAVNEQYEDALFYFSEHVRVAEELDDQHDYGVALSNLGQAYVAMKRPNEGLEVLAKAYQVVESLADRAGQMQVAGAMGSAYRMIGQLKNAAELLSIQFRLAQELGDTANGAMSSFNSAYVYADAHQYADALNLALQAERMFTEMSDIPHTQLAHTLVAEYRTKAR